MKNTARHHIRNKATIFYRCGEENFKIELVRNNMGKRDIVPCVNLFLKGVC